MDDKRKMYTSKIQNDTQDKRKEAYANRRLEMEPCAKERELSLGCLQTNAYDNDKCKEFFINYTICQNFWKHIKQDRMKKGISPPLPPLAERDQVKKEYMDKVYGPKDSGLPQES